MKRLTAICLALLMCLCVLTAGADGAELTYARAVEMAQHMHAIASGDYMASNGVPESIQRRAREWAAGITGEPRLVVRLDLNEYAYIREISTTFMNEHPMVAYEAESSATSRIMISMMAYAAWESVVSESLFEEIVEVNTQLNCEMIYAEEGETGYGMYLVFYEGAAPLLILSSGENGAVSLQASFVPSERLARCRNHGQVALWLMLNGISMTAQEVLPK